MAACSRSPFPQCILFCDLVCSPTQLAETIKRLDAEAEATAADADTICEALDGLKETLGVDSLSDPAAAVLMSQAKAHEPGKPPPIDVGRQALAEADQERKSQLAAQAADARVRQLPRLKAWQRECALRLLSPDLELVTWCAG